jgi:hypothetical protein
MRLLSRLLKRLSPANGSGKRPQRRRASTVRLSLEALEGREVPSATGLVSATTNEFGQAAVFAIDRNGALWTNDPVFLPQNREALSQSLGISYTRVGWAIVSPTRLTPASLFYTLPTDVQLGWVQLSTSTGVSDSSGFIMISATHEAHGVPVVFGLNRAGEIREFDPTLAKPWQVVAGPKGADGSGFTGFSATQNGAGAPELFITTRAGRVWDFNPSVNSAQVDISGLFPGKLAAIGLISAGHDSLENPNVFIVNFDTTIWVWSRSALVGKKGSLPWSQVTFSPHPGISSISATQRADGNSALFVLDNSGAVFDVFTTTKGWVSDNLSVKGLVFTAIDATRAEANSSPRTLRNEATVFAVTADQQLLQFTISSSLWTVVGRGFTGGLAATQKSNSREVVFAFDAQRMLWEHDADFGGGGWLQITVTPNTSSALFTYPRRIFWGPRL